jgi:hypothetical protein
VRLPQPIASPGAGIFAAMFRGLDECSEPVISHWHLGFTLFGAPDHDPPGHQRLYVRKPLA